jgi:hypothetical protein
MSWEAAVLPIKKETQKRDNIGEDLGLVLIRRYYNT